MLNRLKAFRLPPLVKYVERDPGKCLPRGYGYVYFDYRRRLLVCYPLGLHLVVQGARKFYYWAEERVDTRAIDNRVEKAFAEGYKRGRRDEWLRTTFADLDPKDLWEDLQEYRR